MDKDTKHRLERLKALYARLPKITCQKRCQEYCGPISLTELEGMLIKKKYKRLPIADVGTQTCSMLSGGACSIYDLRPLICRMWGTVRAMRCPYGCRPDVYMSDQEGRAIVAEAMTISPPMEKR